MVYEARPVTTQDLRLPSQLHSIATLPCLVLTSRPLTVEGWVGWLHTKTVYPQTVTHLSTNRAQRRVTSLMWPMPLPLRQTATLFSLGLSGFSTKRHQVMIVCHATTEADRE